MKLVTNKSYLLILVVFALVASTGPLAAQVYKTVDKDGNVSYTDKPPPDGSKPIKLAPISVIEAPVFASKPKPGDGDEQAVELSLRDMRKNYNDFEIIAPLPEQSLWQPEQATTVAWNVRYQLQPGMTVTIFVNGQQHATTTDRMIPIGELDRGEHIVRAELKDVKNRIIATARPVIFYIQKPNIYTNRARSAPNG